MIINNIYQKISLRKGLILGLLLAVAPIFNLFPQTPTNEEIYTQKIISFLAKFPKPVKSVEGPLTAGIEAVLKRDSTSGWILAISGIETDVRKISPTQGRRTLKFNIALTDSSGGYTEDVKYADTVELKNLKQLRKTEHVLLRTDDPRFLHRALLPLMCVLGGVAVILTLFYLRS